MLNAQRLEMGKDIIITQAVRENLYATGGFIEYQLAKERCRFNHIIFVNGTKKTTIHYN